MAKSASNGSERAGDAGWNAREIGRRNQAAAGKPLSPVMKTAATACELAHSPAARKKASRDEDPQSGAKPPTRPG